jgi:hypothetical protein
MAVVMLMNNVHLARQGFIRSFEALTSLNHPCIVPETPASGSLAEVLERLSPHREARFWPRAGQAVIICTQMDLHRAI